MNTRELMMSMKRGCLIFVTFLLTCFNGYGADEVFANKLATYSNYDFNSDGIKEIEYLQLMPFESSGVALNPSDRFVVVFVEPRLLNELAGSADTVNDLLERLERFKSDLEAEGYRTRFIKAKVYDGPVHQDGRTVLAIREFFRSLKATYGNFQGAILVGSFPEAMLGRRWIWKRGADDSGITIGGTNYPAGTQYLRIVPETVSHRAELVLADLDGNWQNIYQQGPTLLESIEAVPTAVMGSGWPVNNSVFNCAQVNYTQVPLEDFFWIKDDNYQILNSNPASFSLRLFTAQLHPEMNASDKALPNPVARPEIFVSRINARHIASNPDAHFVDIHGQHFLGADGKPQAVESSGGINLDIGPFWHRDPVLERRFLIDFFDRNHLFRIGRFASLPFRTAAVGYGLGASGLNDILKQASPDFAPSLLKENASLLDYVHWWKEPGVFRGIVAHSSPWNSSFGNGYLVTNLENAVGGKPWRWARVGATFRYMPSLQAQADAADLYLHRTIWENQILMDNGAHLIIHNGCEVNSPGGANTNRYNSENYGEFQNAEGVLFCLNGIAVMSRAKGFYDSPRGFSDPFRQSERAAFGSGWRAYFDVESQDASLPAAVADNKRCYTWSVIGDWTARLRYQNGLGALGLKSGKFDAFAVHPNNAWIGSWNYSSNLNNIKAVGDFNGDGRVELVITSDWGIGILGLNSKSYWQAAMAQPKDTWFGAWRYNASVNTGQDKIEGAADFDGDGKKELLLTSSWGIGILKLGGSTMTSLVAKPKDTWFGVWRYNASVNTGQDKIEGLGDFNGDGKSDILVSSSWGIGILTLSGNTLNSLEAKSYVNHLGSWFLNTNDRIKGIGDFVGAGKAQFLMQKTF